MSANTENLKFENNPFIIPYAVCFLLLTLTLSYPSYSFSEEYSIGDLEAAAKYTKGSISVLKEFGENPGCENGVGNGLYEVDLSSDDKSIVKPVDSTGKFKKLPSHCFKEPKRDSCEFYRDCINDRLQCQRDNLDYAIDYGLKYCNKFKEMKKTAPEPVKKWISDTMLCLQKELKNIWIDNPDYEGVYIFKKGYPSNLAFDNVAPCTAVRDGAFKSHSKCYTKPNGSFKGGVCNIGNGVIKNTLFMFELLLKTTDYKTIKNPTNRSNYLKQIAEVTKECASYYESELKLKSNENKNSGFTKEELQELRRLSLKIQTRYQKLAAENQVPGTGDDSVSDAVPYPKIPMRDVEYPKPSGKYEILNGKTIIIKKDTVISVEELVIGDNVTIILKDGAQLNINALRSKIGDNFKIISESKDGENAPLKRPPTLSQADYGVQGQNGTHGRAGESGEHASNVEIHLGKVQSMGSMNVILRGGNGGNGQSGGHAQQGGGGRCSTGQHPMFGGIGGTAGQGGFPGHGGEFRVSWSNNDSSISNDEFQERLYVDNSIGKGGANGKHGRGGAAGESRAKCCRFITPKWCGEHLDIQGTPGRYGRFRRWDRNYDFESPDHGDTTVVRAGNSQNYRFTPFTLSVSNSRIDDIRKVVGQPSFSNSQRDRNGDVPLSVLLKSNSSRPLEIYKILRTKEIDPNILDSNGKSSIDLVIESNFDNKVELLRALIEDGAHLNYPDLLKKALNSGDEKLIKFLLSQKEFSVKELSEAHSISSDKIRKLLFKELVKKGADSVDYLSKAYSNTDKQEKRDILKFLGQLESPKSSRALLDLYETENNSDLKNEAFKYIEAKRDSNPTDRMVRIQLTSRRDGTLDHVFNVIRSRSVNERESFYLKEMSHKNEGVRIRSVRGVGELKSKSAVPVLLTMIQNEKEKGVMEEVVRSLGEIGDKRALDPLKKLLKDSPYGIGFDNLVIEAIKKLDSSNSEIDELIDDLYDESGMPDYLVVQKLVAKGEKVVEPIINSLKSLSEQGIVPQGHYLVLGMLGSVKAVPGLIEEIKVRKNPMFLSRPIVLLGQLGDKSAIPEIKKFLNHPDEIVREAAEEALEALGSNKRQNFNEEAQKLNYFKNLLNIPH